MVYRRVACFLLGGAKLYYWELAGEWKVGRAEKWEERRGEERGTDARTASQEAGREEGVVLQGCVCVHASRWASCLCVSREFMLACLVE